MKKILKLILAVALTFSSTLNFNNKVNALENDENKSFLEELNEKGTAVFGNYTVEVEKENIYHIHDTGTSNPSSMYLFVSDQEALLFDGSNGTAVEEFNNVLDLLVGNRELSVAITHNHGDHVGMFVKQAFDKDVKIYMPELDYDEATQKLFADNGYTNIQLINDNDVISCGKFKLTTQYLSGHTMGSMVFIENNEQVVVSGDAVGSGFVWQLFVDDALTKYEKGLKDLIASTSSMEHLVILPGHKWQTTIKTESGTEGPGKLGQQYLSDMLKVLDGIYNKTANYVDYSHIASFFEDSIEATVEGAKAAIDTRKCLVEQYITNKNSKFIEDLNNNGTAVYGNYTVEVEKENIYHIHDTGTSNPSSMYLFVSDQEALLFDGSNGTAVEEFNNVLDLLVGNRELSVAITHNHGDHVGMFVKHAFDKDVKIYMPELDYDEATQKLFADNGYTNIQLINDNDVISCGKFKLTAQYLSGHTMGSMVFIENNEQVVVSGDAVGSGFVWQLFVDDALTKYEKGLKDLIKATSSMDHLVILPGHKWQTTIKTESGTEGPGKLGQQYLSDMLKVLDGIYNKTANYVDYSHIASFFEDSIEATVEGAKAAIDTRKCLVEQYIASRTALEKGDINSDNDIVKTGDTTPVMLYGGLAVLGLGCLVLLKKRKSHK